MKKYLVSVLFLSGISVAVANDWKDLRNLIPEKGFIQTKASVERYRIKSWDENEKENYTKSIVKSIFSLQDNRCVIEFDPLETPMKNNEKSDYSNRFIQKVTFIWDGRAWKKMLYKNEFSDSNSIEQVNTLVVADKIPLEVDFFEDLFSGKAFFYKNFVFFEGYKESLTISDVLTEKHEFPPTRIEKIGNNLIISAETSTNIFNATISLEGSFPILREYRKIFNNRENNRANLNYIFKFTGSRHVLNLPIAVPHVLKYVMFDEEDNKGHVIIVTVEYFELLNETDFNKFIPEIPAGWSIFDEKKNIIYKKGETLQEVLQSVKGL